MSLTNEKIDEIENGFKELLSEEKPKIFSGTYFHTLTNILLTNYMDFSLIGERNVVYQFYRDVFEYKPFTNNSPKGFVKDIPRGIEELEKLTKDLERHFSGRLENYSRMSVYKGKIGEQDLAGLTGREAEIQKH